MNYSFYRPESIDLNEFSKIIGSLKASLEELLSGECEISELQDFTERLIEDQDNDGFWGLVDPEQTPSDARVDFYYMPTYYATAILMRYLIDHPEDVDGIENFKECLAKGLKASTERGLKGHGYENIEGVIEAMKIFCTAGLPRFIGIYPDLCTEFSAMIEVILTFIKNSIENNDTKGMWGEDYLPEFIYILEQFPEE